ncbi:MULTISPECIES: glycosyltransferase family 61 protein [unclassified Mucilaginibacter]|uniref:glycosyltransferase family 61 protein n=1 Tax=unclassified Mucilaginibacter TaxID=2617802 RepID=UPI002AC8CC48|nr:MULTISPECIES: glycosyltransferase family 61 protein [unclassified Mucilaginibacter]MEB0280869.1 glycosyltransferase family 61 protein [Mucilaginibacter sp. 10B2]MEB0302750.1 glycosyltransferase family 61 protein [Mucilaginibacter sp. 5C4]WPX25648.1 glycosyltransferase family 61 protein [Mucilaginibacter sp. 5C4]
MMVVKVPVPLNVRDDLRGLYLQNNKFLWKRPSIKRLKNVFVTNSGLCVTADGLVKECHHGYADQYDDYLNEVSHHYHCALERPESVVELYDGNTYLLIHSIWFNYYHWLSEPIYRLWMVRHKLDKMTLLLPEQYKGVDFIEGSLAPFKVQKIVYIPEGKNLLVENLCMPQIKPVCDSYHPIQLKKIRSFYHKFIKSRKSLLSSKIYLSRKKAGRRQIVNEAETEDVLISHGFAIYYPEDYTFLEQVLIMSETRYLISTHGSGLTNIMFMKAGASVLELHQLHTNYLEHPSFAFWYMASVLDINYYHQPCEFSGTEDYFTSDYLVDPTELDRNVQMMLAGRAKDKRSK